MQLRLFIALLIYLGSYFPLSLILLIQDIQLTEAEGILSKILDIFIGEIGIFKNRFLALYISLASALFLIIGIFCIKIIPKTEKILIVESKHIPADLINYTIPYVVSFLNLDYSDTLKLIGFFLFLGCLFLITYKSGQIALNPLLLLFGWRLYEIKYRHPASKDVFVGRILSLSGIEPEESYYQGRIQDIMIADNRERRNG